MNIYITLLIMTLLIFIIILLVYKLITINISLKEIEHKMKTILNTDTNSLISTSTDNKIVNNFVNKLNVHIKEIRKQELEFKNGNKEIRRSITDISHDLRTPLTSIRGYIDLLKKEKSTKKQKEYLKIIDERVDNLIFLTEQLFDYSKALDTQDRIKKENICINTILEETIISYYALFKKKNVSPIIKICENKIYRHLDPNMLTRIFENIISNCIKHSQDNLNITLTTTGKIIFSNQTSNLDRISIEKIFDRYYTVENAKNNSGVGLSIAKQLVELNGGEISATYRKNTLIIEIDF